MLLVKLPFDAVDFLWLITKTGLSLRHADQEVNIMNGTQRLRRHATRACALVRKQEGVGIIYVPGDICERYCLFISQSSKTSQDGSEVVLYYILNYIAKQTESYYHLSIIHRAI